MRSRKIEQFLQLKSMDMFPSYGHIIRLKWNHRFFDDFRPGHVPLNIKIYKYLLIWLILLLYLGLLPCNHIIFKITVILLHSYFLMLAAMSIKQKIEYHQRQQEVRGPPLDSQGGGGRSIFEIKNIGLK